MIACPSCNRRIFTRRDLLYATFDGAVQCRWCGRQARLDMLSRWMILCVLSVVLPTILLYGGVFYSGHLFLVSIVVVFGVWGALAFVAFPFLALEVMAGAHAINRRHGILTFVVILLAAMILDGFIASRFEPEKGIEQDGRSASAVRHDR